MLVFVRLVDAVDAVFAWVPDAIDVARVTQTLFSSPYACSGGIHGTSIDRLLGERHPENVPVPRRPYNPLHALRGLVWVRAAGYMIASPETDVSRTDNNHVQKPSLADSVDRCQHARQPSTCP